MLYNFPGIHLDGKVTIEGDSLRRLDGQRLEGLVESEERSSFQIKSSSVPHDVRLVNDGPVV